MHWNLLGVFKKYQCLAPTCSHSDSGMEFGGFKSPLDYANMQHSLTPSQMLFPQRAHKPPLPGAVKMGKHSQTILSAGHALSDLLLTSGLSCWAHPNKEESQCSPPLSFFIALTTFFTYLLVHILGSLSLPLSSMREEQCLFTVYPFSSSWHIISDLLMFVERINIVLFHCLLLLSSWVTIERHH